MAKAYGEDLRARVVAAVEGGLSRRAAAERFQVGVPTAIGWVRAWREGAWRAAKPGGGDTRPRRTEAFRGVTLAAAAAQPDVTLAGLAALLGRERAASFAPSSVRRFLARRRVTSRRGRRTPASESARTRPGAGKPGSTPSLPLIPSGWPSSTKAAPAPRW